MIEVLTRLKFNTGHVLKIMLKAFLLMQLIFIYGEWIIMMRNKSGS